MQRSLGVLAFIYAIFALISGLFMREYTKAMNFTGESDLSLIHTHYFVLGVGFVLILLLLERAYKFLRSRASKTLFVIYNVGLNVTVIAFLMRGIQQVAIPSAPKALNASISGVAGLGHILLTIGIIGLLWILMQKLPRSNK